MFVGGFVGLFASSSPYAVDGLFTMPVNGNCFGISGSPPCDFNGFVVSSATPYSGAGNWLTISGVGKCLSIRVAEDFYAYEDSFNYKA